MPIYEFSCCGCDHRFEELIRAAGLPAAVLCPLCGSAKTLRLMSAFAVSKGSPGGEALSRVLSEGSGEAGGCCGGACGGH